jgi:hypothetical protein
MQHGSKSLNKLPAPHDAIVIDRPLHLVERGCQNVNWVILFLDIDHAPLEIWILHGEGLVSDNVLRCLDGIYNVNR